MEKVERIREVEPEGSGKGLGRHKHFDEKSRAFAAVGAVVDDSAPIKTKTWYRRGVFDQGSSSSCTGQSTKGLVFTSPNLTKLAKPTRAQVDAYALYKRAQEIDPWDGAEPDYYGSSCLAAMKAAKEAGYIAEYRWCFGLDDVLRTLSNYGPVVIGVNWYSSFDDTDKKGFLNIAEHAFIRGGHAIEILGNNIKGKYVTGVNSWGYDWGIRGRFKIPHDTLGRLLSEDGEAVTAVVG